MIENSSEPKRSNYDLEERTAAFAELSIEFAYSLVQNPISKPLISQFVRSATSIGANYCEADDAQSKKDFKHKIALCRKESRETKYWLRVIAKACPDHADAARKLWSESKELNLIFSRIFRSTKPD